MANEYLDIMNAQQRKNFLEIVKQQEEQMLKAYAQAAQDLLKNFNATNGPATKWRINEYIKSLNADIQAIITSNASLAAQLPADLNAKIMEQVAKDLSDGTMDSATFKKIFGQVPRQTVANILDGKIYADGKGLSQRIWSNTAAIGNNINEIVASGLARQISAKELSKMVAGYVDPTAKKDWSKRAGELLGRGYGKIEYNSIRLARTTITHSFTLANKLAAKENPFVEGLKWNLSKSHDDRQVRRFGTDICDKYAGKVFPIDDYPYEHPNGLCYSTPAIDKSFDDLAQELSDWAKGGANPKLDEWYAKHQDTVGDEIAVGLANPPKKKAPAKPRAPKAPTEPIYETMHKQVLKQKKRDKKYDVFAKNAQDLIQQELGLGTGVKTAKKMTLSIDPRDGRREIFLDGVPRPIMGFAKGADNSDTIEKMFDRISKCKDLGDILALRRQLDREISDAPMGPERIQARMNSLYADGMIQAQIKAITAPQKVELPKFKNTLEQKALFAPTIRTPLSAITKNGNEQRSFMATYEKAVEFMSTTLHPELAPKSQMELNVMPSGKRAYCSGIVVSVATNTKSSVIVHEAGHAMHNVNGEMQQVVTEFFNRRIAGEKLTTIYAGTDEVGYKDKFQDHYTGRWYKWDKPEKCGTEVVSMGMQYMAEDPTGFYAKDPEYFTLIYGLMRGLAR